MKSLAELRALFVGARNLAKEASPAKAKEAADMLKGISDHCKELYEVATSYMERAKCRNIYESIDNVIELLGAYGFCHETIAGFFGLANSKGVSFGDISAGKGTILKHDIPKATATASEPGTVFGGILNDTPKSGSVSKTTVAPPRPAAPPAPMPSEPASDPVSASSNDLNASGDNPNASDNANGDASNSDSGASYLSLDARLEPQCLDDFIGQKHIIKRIKEEIAVAKKEGRQHLDNIMMFGRPGLGKTTLMYLIAKEMGVDFEFMDCSSFMNDVRSHRKLREFFIRISNNKKPVVIGLDEIHCLSDTLQSNLLTLLQSRFYSDMLDNGETVRYEMPEFTFIGATTDYDSVLPTIKDRARNLTFHLVDYTRDELRQIFTNKLAAAGHTASAKVVDACVNRCRSSMRIMTAIVKGLHTKAVLADTNVITMNMVDDYFDAQGIDAIGLNHIEREILKVLSEGTGSALSAETLAARVSVKDAKILMREHEPYLIKIGFISIISRGRSLTGKARNYLDYGYYDFGEGVTIGSLHGGDGTDSEPEPPAAPETPTVQAEPPLPVDNAAEAPQPLPIVDGAETVNANASA